MRIQINNAYILIDTSIKFTCFFIKKLKDAFTEMHERRTNRLPLGR